MSAAADKEPCLSQFIAAEADRTHEYLEPGAPIDALWNQVLIDPGLVPHGLPSVIVHQLMPAYSAALEAISDADRAACDQALHTQLDHATRVIQEFADLADSVRRHQG